MAFMVQVSGDAILGGVGGATPNELYGIGVFGPAVFGGNNRSGLDDASASTFDSLDGARGLFQILIWAYPSNEYRIVETPTGLLESVLNIEPES